MSKLEDSLFEEFRLFGFALPDRQYRFHPRRKWRLDFAWPDRMIAVEINGGIYVGGRHSRGPAQENDFEKVNQATRMGWKVFTFGPAWCKCKKNSRQSSQALAFMYEALRELAIERGQGGKERRHSDARDHA